MNNKNRLLARRLDEEAAPGGITNYQERVGHCQWGVCTPRPDIARATSKLVEFLANLSAVNEKALKHFNRLPLCPYYQLPVL